ncbi:hypothetical protein PDO_1174 [Rhizobium sp. PDO1-076]|nr:hypothetical protein PDO_1174 [Rhizobium sp. PDO1-076]
MDMLHIDALQMAALQKKMKSIGAFSIAAALPEGP